MRRMIAVRREYRAFGRGTTEFIPVPNKRVLVYVRRHEGETILCMANLSRYAQPVEIDLNRFAGCVPLELWGRLALYGGGSDPQPYVLARQTICYGGFHGSYLRVGGTVAVL